MSTVQTSPETNQAADTAAPARTSSGPLINRNFACVWAGQSISFIGDSVLDFTLALWIAFSIGRGQPWAPLAVSGVLISSSVGALLIGPIAGVFVDRWDKRRTMIGVTMLQALLTLALLLVADIVPLPFFAGGHPSLETKLVTLYAIIFLVYGLAQFSRAARIALVGDIVAEADRAQASGMTETMANLSYIIGYGIAPLLFVPFGIGFALIADALSFVLAIGAFAAVHAPLSARSVRQGERGSVRREFVDGVRFTLGNLITRTVLLVYVLVLFGAGAINALFVFFVAQDLHASQAAIGSFPVVLGVGLVVGSLIGGALARRFGLTRVFWVSIIVLGITGIALSRQTSLIPGLICAFLVGVPNGTMNIALMPLVLGVTPREMVGRVMNVIEASLTVAQVASIALFGTLAGTVFSNLHLNVLGQPLDAYSGLILLASVICILAGLLAFANLRRATVSALAKVQV
jgi:MFS family permease